MSNSSPVEDLGHTLHLQLACLVFIFNGIEQAKDQPQDLYELRANMSMKLQKEMETHQIWTSIW